MLVIKVTRYVSAVKVLKTDVPSFQKKFIILVYSLIVVKTSDLIHLNSRRFSKSNFGQLVIP